MHSVHCMRNIPWQNPLMYDVIMVYNYVVRKPRIGYNPWIALLKAWIRTLHRQSVDCTTLAQSRDCATHMHVRACVFECTWFEHHAKRKV